MLQKLGILRSLNHQCPNFLVIFHFMVLTLLWKMCFVIYVLAVRSRKQKPSQRRRKNSIIWWPLSAKFQVSSFAPKFQVSSLLPGFKVCSQVSRAKFCTPASSLLSYQFSSVVFQPLKYHWKKTTVEYGKLSMLRISSLDSQIL